MVIKRSSELLRLGTFFGHSRWNIEFKNAKIPSVAICSTLNHKLTITVFVGYCVYCTVNALCLIGCRMTYVLSQCSIAVGPPSATMAQQRRISENSPPKSVALRLINLSPWIPKHCPFECGMWTYTTSQIKRCERGNFRNVGTLKRGNFGAWELEIPGTWELRNFDGNCLLHSSLSCLPVRIPTFLSTNRRPL